jgi:hypothetical protein
MVIVARNAKRTRLTTQPGKGYYFRIDDIDIRVPQFAPADDDNSISDLTKMGGTGVPDPPLSHAALCGV